MRTKHILLPTDFSSNARNAIDYAILLLQKEECVFYILNAFEVGASGLSSTMGKAKNTRLYISIKEESERNTNRLLKELKEKNKNSLHQFEGLSISDSLLNAIGSTTIEYGISYVIMGTKGASGIKEVFMGSNTVSVITNINFCRIIAVPEDYSFNIPHEIAFATNFEYAYSKAEFDPLLDLVKLWDSEIVMLHVETGNKLTAEQENLKQLLIEYLDDSKLRLVEVKGKSSISEAITSFISNNKDLGMITMVNYQHNIFYKLMSESVIKRVAFHSAVPFLVIPHIPP